MKMRVKKNADTIPSSRGVLFTDGMCRFLGKVIDVGDGMYDGKLLYHQWVECWSYEPAWLEKPTGYSNEEELENAI